MFKLALSLLLFALLSSNLSGQDLEYTNGRIQQAVADRNYPSAINDLQKIKTNQPAVFEANNYNYLLARLADRTGDLANAAANYQAVVNADSVLKEYALWHLAQIARGTGNLLLERTYLQRIIEFSPDSLLAAAARSRLVKSWFESGSYDQVIKALTSSQPGAFPVDARRAEQVKRQNLVLLGDAYLKSGEAAKARETYTKLVTEISNPAQPDDFALAAAKALDALDLQQPTGSAAQPLPDYEHLRRASIYQFNRDFNDARRHYVAIIEEHPTSGIVPDAMFQIGRGYAQEGNFNEAINWFERVQEQFPEHAAAKDALMQAASAYSRLGKYREAVSRYQKYIDTFKDDERLDRAYLNIVDVLRDSRQDGEALKWTAKIQEVFKGKQAEAMALFDEAKICLSKSDWQSALAALGKLQTLPDLGGTTVPGGTNPIEVTFLRGFVLENLGRFQEATDVYLSIPDGRSEYYGGRATERLRMLSASEAARPIMTAKLAELTATTVKDKEVQRRDLQSAIRLAENLQDREKFFDRLKKLYAELPAYKNTIRFELLKLGRQQSLTEKATVVPAMRYRAVPDELLFLGLYDEAGPEVEAAYKPKENPPAGSPRTDLDYTIAVIYNRGDRADRAAAFIEPLWKMPADYQFELIPRDIAEMLYPVPYADSLIRYAPQREVDPRYLLSIMRQESRFRPDVKSYAAARGLMQFISSTSGRIAAELGRKNFRQDDLYDPATAILFGSQYLGNLFKMFPRQPEAVAASYNGGEDSMKRWMSRSRSDQPDSYVPEIVFSQSKDYVYRVMANYKVYQFLYDSNLANQ